MQELRKTLKKVAAVGTSLVLVGVTVSGALAAGLGDLPAPFDGKAANTVVVYADGDLDAANDVVSGLPGGSAAVAASASALGELALTDFESGEREDLDVGVVIDLAANLGHEFDDDQDVGLTKFSVAIDIDGPDTDYDAHEVIDLGDGVADEPDSIVLTTAIDIVNPDQDFGDKVFLAVPSAGFDYNIVLEEDLDDGNTLADDGAAGDEDGGVDADHAVTVPFLGKNLVITGAGNDGDSITAYAGDKVKLKVGDTVQAAGKTVKLEGVDDDSALITVDGESDSIDENNRNRVNDVEVYVDDVFNSDDDANDQAILVVEGSVGQAVDTYNAGDQFIDEDENHYLWEWNIANLHLIDVDWATSLTPFTLGITLHEDLDDPNVDDFEDEIMDLGLLKVNKGYLEDGDYLCLPYRYACLVLEGPAEDIAFAEYEIAAGETVDLSDALGNAAVLNFKSNVGNSKGFLVGTGSAESDEMYVYFNDNDNDLLNLVTVYYEDPDETDPVLATVDIAAGDDDEIAVGETAVIATFDNDDYNAEIDVGLNGAGTIITVTIEGLGDTAGDIVFTITPEDNDGIDFLGNTDGGTLVAEDMFYDTDVSGDFLAGTDVDLTHYDATIKRADGTVIQDAEDNLENEKVVLDIPDSNEYKYWVRLAKTKGGSAAPVVSRVASLKMKDTEVGDVATLGKNVIAVGGPAVNKVTASLLGLTFPAYGAASGLTEGAAVLELKNLGTKKALLVYGWEAADTRKAATVVKNAATYKAQLEGKTNATVSGEGSSLTVSAISA